MTEFRESQTVEVEVRQGDAPSILGVAYKTAERQNPGFRATAARYTGRRGPHGERLFEVDLDETNAPVRRVGRPGGDR